jgi:hypothetical protein
MAVVVGRRWLERRSELAFAIRSLAGAASRSGPVAVVVPGDPGKPEVDGAFDLRGIGAPGALKWPDGVPTDTTIIVDELTAELASLLGSSQPSQALFLSARDDPISPVWQTLRLVGGVEAVGVHVPVNRLAERYRHHGFGFTDYLLVLSDRHDDAGEAPPPAAAWVSAGFPDADVVVVENAEAWAWKGRALRGKVSVDTRMDLWRLLAHANVCIDLGPGPIIARECIEALRFGTPVIVPDRTGPAVVHAHESGGSVFGDPDELLDAVGRMQNDKARSAVSDAGRRYSESHFGDPIEVVARMQALLSTD